MSKLLGERKTGRFAAQDQIRIAIKPKTANALGVTVTPLILARADEVIE